MVIASAVCATAYSQSLQTWAWAEQACFLAFDVACISVLYPILLLPSCCFSLLLSNISEILLFLSDSGVNPFCPSPRFAIFFLYEQLLGKGG